ncbi:hypothetical protein O1611_g10486 [Lasiodiplodia mahajangana]|uniref:Uncharacterized protein n=1 Tax=Lasiodiplodia mahajangana TaxID=1108764 RepID=A0ACC2IXM7_9PEZI|nr:hypothetical protein O1611_g10486 [Lasiodiplodia mahajangana]
MASLSLDTSLPMRPSYGSKGTDIVLWANYFALQAPAQLVLYQHNLTVTPQAAGKKLSHIIRLFLQTPELKAVSQQVATDFKSILIAREQIASQSIELPYRAEGEDEPLRDARKYTVKLDLDKALSVGDLVTYLASADMNTQPIETSPIIQGLNILVNHFNKSKPSDQVATIGSSKSFSLSTKDTMNLDDCVRGIRGYFTSVRAATARILLNVQINHSAFYIDMDLDTLMTNFKNNGGSLPQFESFIRRLRVKVNHLKTKYNKNKQEIIRAKVISRLANIDDGRAEQGHPQLLAHLPRVKRYGAGARDVEFWLDAPPGGNAPSTPKGKGAASAGGRYISVYDYFKSAYKIAIRDPNLPVVNVGTKEKPTYLPAQVCTILPGQPMRRQLSPGQTSKMIAFAVRPPAANATSIVNEGLKANGLPGGASPTQLEKFGAAVSTDLITVRGRLLQEPRVIYSNNQLTFINGGSWNMVRSGLPMKFCVASRMPKWGLVNFEMAEAYPYSFKISDELLPKIKEAYKDVWESAGLMTGPSDGVRTIKLKNDDDPALDTYFQDATKRGVRLLFVILPQSPIPLYNRIKKLGDTKHAIHTLSRSTSNLEAKITTFSPKAWA